MRSRSRITRWGMLAAAAVLAAGLTACSPGKAGNVEDGPGNAASGGDDRPLVLTTFTVLADIAQNVAGEHLTVESITKVGAEIHGYEPTPKDIARATEAQLILDNGLNLELWFEQFVESVDASHVVVLPTANPVTHTREVRVSLPSGAYGVSPGMFARTTLPLADSRPDRITVPATAVVRRPEFAAVYVVGADGRANLRQVRLGRHSGDAVEVVAGLSAGECIAVDSVAAARQ